VTWKLESILPVWALAALGAVLVGAFSASDETNTWLAIVFAGVVLATFGIQLSLKKTEGFVTRAMTSIGGGLIILAVATGIFFLASLNA